MLSFRSKGNWYCKRCGYTATNCIDCPQCKQTDLLEKQNKLLSKQAKSSSSSSSGSGGAGGTLVAAIILIVIIWSIVKEIALFIATHWVIILAVVVAAGAGYYAFAQYRKEPNTIESDSDSPSEPS
jgi:hypothetical protein